MTTHPEPWTEWIGTETVGMLYADGIRLHGGSGSAPKDGCVEGALGAAYNAELYSRPEIEPEGLISGLVFCGHLLFYLSTKHCYIDGNKRIAWSCAMFVLLRIGLTIEATEDEVVAFCLQIADGEVRSASEVVTWIGDRLAPIA
jgi:death on curing protein